MDNSKTLSSFWVKWMMTCEDQFSSFFKDEERKKGRFIEGVGCNVQWVEIFSEGALFLKCV